MTGSIQSTVSYQRFKRILSQLTDIGVQPKQATAVLRLVHDTIDECKGYHYARVAAAADRALEAVIQEAKGSKFQAPLIGELVVCDTPCSNNGCIHRPPHRRTAACIKNQCDWNSYARGEDITACCVPDVSRRADFKLNRDSTREVAG